MQYEVDSTVLLVFRDVDLEVRDVVDDSPEGERDAEDDARQQVDGHDADQGGWRR